MATRDAEETTQKLAQLRALLEEHRAPAVVLGRVANFAWATGGGRSFVNVATDFGAAWAVVGRAGAWVVASNIEAQRLAEEEVDPATWEPVAYAWWEPEGAIEAVRRLTGAEPSALLSDGALPGARDVSRDLARLRQRLGRAEVRRAQALGRDLAEALEATCRAAQPGETEWAVAGRLAAACCARGIVPVVHLVAADERACRRHPLPTDRPVARYALVAVSGMRGGLVASATRLVHWGPVPPELLRRWRAAAQVEAELLAATRPGALARDLFALAQDAYARAGFPDEWRHHHQGGLAGYASREWRATPTGTEVLAADQLVAWNPTVAGAKSEDTVRTREDDLPEVLTRTGSWPEEVFVARSGARIPRPAILERQGTG